MVEEATHAGYPMDAAAVLLIELEGLREQLRSRRNRSARRASPAARANSASPARTKSATCCGRAARTRSELLAGLAPLTTCRTV